MRILPGDGRGRATGNVHSGTLAWCTCPAFVLWYSEAEVPVCRCGHPDAEHLDDSRMCLGDVLILGGAR